LVPIHAAEISAFAGDTFGAESDSPIGATSALILRKYAEPNAMSLGLMKDCIDHSGQECTSVAAIGTINGNSLDCRYPLGRGPITNDGKTDQVGTIAADKIRMTVVDKCGSVLRLIPPTNQALISGDALRAHDEWNVGCVGALDRQLRRVKK